MSLETKCVVCGSEVDRFDICDKCGWQDDGVQNADPNYKGGANKMSLIEARKAYKENREIK